MLTYVMGLEPPTVHSAKASEQYSRRCVSQGTQAVRAPLDGFAARGL
jgi:hypothetical protein